MNLMAFAMIDNDSRNFDSDGQVGNTFVKKKKEEEERE